MGWMVVCAGEKVYVYLCERVYVCLCERVYAHVDNLTCMGLSINTHKCITCLGFLLHHVPMATHTSRAHGYTGLRMMGYNIDDSEGEQLLLGLDINHDGSVTFDEFAACLLDWKQVLWCWWCVG